MNSSSVGLNWLTSEFWDNCPTMATDFELVRSTFQQAESRPIIVTSLPGLSKYSENALPVYYP